MFASYIHTLGRTNIPVIRDLGDIAGAFPLYFDRSTAPGTFLMLWDGVLLKEIQKITLYPVETIRRAYTAKFETAIQQSPYIATRVGNEGYTLTYRTQAAAANQYPISNINISNIPNNDVPGNVMRQVMANIHSGKSRSRRSSRRRSTRKMRR